MFFTIILWNLTQIISLLNLICHWLYTFQNQVHVFTFRSYTASKWVKIGLCSPIYFYVHMFVLSKTHLQLLHAWKKICLVSGCILKLKTFYYGILSRHLFLFCLWSDILNRRSYYHLQDKKHCKDTYFSNVFS